MTPILEEITRHLLVAARFLPHFVSIDEHLDAIIHIFIGLLDLRRRVAQAEGAGHIEEIAPAGLARENVEDDGFPQLDYILGAAFAVGHAGVTPDGEDEAFWVLQPFRGDEVGDFIVYPPDGQRGSVLLNQRLAPYLM